MTVQPRTCPVDGCAEEIRPGCLMCGTHWASVPRERRREIHRTWSLYLEAADPEQETIARRDYLLARAAAIRSANNHNLDEETA